MRLTRTLLATARAQTQNKKMRGTGVSTIVGIIRGHILPVVEAHHQPERERLRVYEEIVLLHQKESDADFVSRMCFQCRTTRGRPLICLPQKSVARYTMCALLTKTLNSVCTMSLVWRCFGVVEAGALKKPRLIVFTAPRRSVRTTRTSAVKRDASTRLFLIRRVQRKCAEIVLLVAKDVMVSHTFAVTTCLPMTFCAETTAA
jgi:hypothetical protein